MNTKIAIGLPTGGTIKAKTAFSLMEMIRLTSYDFLPIFRHGPYISENKEKIVGIAKEQKCTHMFFVDHDMKFKPSVIEVLISQDKDVIGGLYNYRFLPKTPMNKFFDKEGKTVAISEIPKETFEVPAIGGGMLLIKMSVFEKIELPYFLMTYNKKGEVEITEDVGFCEKIRKVGFKIWCDPTLPIKHIGDYEY